MGSELFGDYWRHLGPFSSSGGLDELEEAFAKRPSRWLEFTYTKSF
jgi:hypothetical protein